MNQLSNSYMMAPLFLYLFYKEEIKASKINYDKVKERVLNPEIMSEDKPCKCQLG